MRFFIFCDIILIMNVSLLFPFFALLNAITSVVLAIFLLFSNHRSKTTWLLIFLCLATAAWSFPYFLWQIAVDADSAIFWCRTLMFGAIFTSIAYLHLVTVFLGLDKIKFYRVVLLIYYLFSFLWVGINFTPYFVAGVYSVSYFKFWPIAGPFYLPYLVSFISQFIYASYLLFRALKKAKGPFRVQIILLLTGLLIAFVGGSTNYPLWFGINIPPWGNGVVSIYVVLTVYAIMKYKFLDIKVISAELFTGLLFVVLLLNAFLSNGVLEFILRISAVVVVSILGLLLVRSIKKEVGRREEITHLAHSLERANIRLQELDKQKTEFLSIATHQLRTPLSILKGYIELIMDGAYGKVTPKIAHVLKDMDASNEHLVKLVDEFLDISHIEQGKIKFVYKDGDINKIVGDVVKDLREKADAIKRKIVWKENHDLVLISLDEEKIHHVVYNYIDNALKYSGKGSVEVRLEKKEGGIVCRVKDRGVGFEKNDEVNFFQKFYRGENVKGMNVNGTGLGLFVCRKFIEAHNGRIWARSRGLGKGSEFGFWIPLKK